MQGLDLFIITNLGCHSIGIFGLDLCRLGISLPFSLEYLYMNQELNAKEIGP